MKSLVPLEVALANYLVQAFGGFVATVAPQSIVIGFDPAKKIRTDEVMGALRDFGEFHQLECGPGVILSDDTMVFGLECEPDVILSDDTMAFGDGQWGYRECAIVLTPNTEQALLKIRIRMHSIQPFHIRVEDGIKYPVQRALAA